MLVLSLQIFEDQFADQHRKNQRKLAGILLHSSHKFPWINLIALICYNFVITLTMIIKVRKIGNSVGILLPKAIMDQCAIKDEVSLEVKENSIIIQSTKKKSRQGWEEAFLKAGSLNDQELLMGEFSNSFDKEEWTW